jgi:molybdopterin-guanine dinucleotide biosynthesis protein A
MISGATERPAPGLFGLVLAGGRSTRMKSDKATLPYGGRTQPERVFELLMPFCARVFLSIRRDQAGTFGREAFSLLCDTVEGLGPMGGILSAFEAHPGAAWLVLACDLPYVDAATLGHLVRHRNREKVATAFASAHDGLPEPLCAIYEPRAAAALRDFVARGVRCPRKALMQSDTEILQPVNPRALDNVNTPEEYRAALRTLEGTP